MLVQLSGPTGSGKSVAASKMMQSGFHIVREPFSKASPMKEGGAQDSHAFSTQKCIMLSRLERFKRTSGSDKIALDRSVDEDFYVFCQLFRRAGLLSDGEMIDLADVHDQTKNELPNPDIVFFFNASPNVLRKRLHLRGENRLILRTLDLQLELYATWRRSISCNVVDVDTTDLDVGSYWPIIKEAIDA